MNLEIGYMRRERTPTFVDPFFPEIKSSSTEEVWFFLNNAMSTFTLPAVAAWWRAVFPVKSFNATSSRDIISTSFSTNLEWPEKAVTCSAVMDNNMEIFAVNCLIILSAFYQLPPSAARYKSLWKLSSKFQQILVYISTVIITKTIYFRLIIHVYFMQISVCVVTVFIITASLHVNVVLQRKISY
ncbi:hypothetical protein Q3G72_030513 [Acer saccharum]|nr:hypothetical protein Q3G72_030513 [Acer saccharum]